MGYFSKETYEAKLEWRSRHNYRIKKECKKLSEEAHDLIADIHSARHEFHCDRATSDSECYSSRTFETLVELVYQVKNFKKLPPLELPYDYETLPIENDFYEYKVYESYDEMMSAHYDAKEEINDCVRDWIKKINKKFEIDY